MKANASPVKSFPKSMLIDLLMVWRNTEKRNIQSAMFKEEEELKDFDADEK